MDLYTAAFSYPQPTPYAPVAPPGSAPTSTVPLPKGSSPQTQSDHLPSSPPYVEKNEDWRAVQKLVEDVTAREGCHVTVTREQASLKPTSTSPTAVNNANTSSTAWNFHFSGNYQSVMAARGAILRGLPREHRAVLKIPRVELLHKPRSSSPCLKPEVRRHLHDIAYETKAFLSIASVEQSGGEGGSVLATVDGRNIAEAPVHTPAPSNAPLPSVSSQATPVGTPQVASISPNGVENGPEDESDGHETDALEVGATINGNGVSVGNSVRNGLKTERMCEITVMGSAESIEVAKVLILVSLDKLSGLHVESVEIDCKMQGVIASRKRSVLQSIQEQCVANIYYPVPLIGVFNPPQPSSRPVGYRSISGGSMNGSIYGINGMSGHHMGMDGHLGVLNGTFPHHARDLGPVYDPHQHVHYPYHPQPLDLNPQTARRMQYAGPGVHHFASGPGAMNGQYHQPMVTNHTGMSQMSHMSQPALYGNNRMVSPVPINMHPHGNGQTGQPGLSNMQYQGGPNGGHPNHYVHMGSKGYSSPEMPGALYHGQPNIHDHVAMQNGIGMGVQVSMEQGMSGSMGHFPSPGTNDYAGAQGLLGKANQVWISGDFFAVQRAREMLINLAVQKSKLLISRDAAILPRKLDWLLTERLEELRTIMSDNGTHIQVPPVGSQLSLITVFGDHRVNIERTTRSVMALACQFYVAYFWLLPLSFDVLGQAATVNSGQMNPIIKRISNATGAEIVFKSNCFEMHGLEHEVRAAVMMIQELDEIRDFQHEIRFQIELANEHRDFISGKKNGKINKIMKLANVRIKFETFSDYNFLIEVSGTGLNAVQGLSMLQEELPAEISFFVPEFQHKRIIGVGGKNIQRVMKLYGVYVKFSNAEEFASLGGYLDNEDNVVARTPAKNAINLESLKQSVMEQLLDKDKDYTMEQVSIPRRYHRILLGDKSIFLHDVEKKTSSVVRFPYKETGSDMVSVFAPESQMSTARTMLLDLVPFEAELRIPASLSLKEITDSTEFRSFTDQMNKDHHISIIPSPKPGKRGEAIFRFLCPRSMMDFLGTARDALERFLVKRGVQVLPSTEASRIDQSTSAFFHFNSKLLATGNAQNHPSSEAQGEADGSVTRRERPDPAASDVKALFDGGVPPVSPAFRSKDDSLGFAGPLSYHDPRRVNDPWQSPGQHSVPIPSEPAKRDSDPLIQEKVRKVGQPPTHSTRAINARTQSLDMSSLSFARAMAGHPFGPTPSAGVVNAGPNTATGQFFPGPRALRANTSGRPLSKYESSVEDLSQGLANVAVGSTPLAPLN